MRSVYVHHYILDFLVRNPSAEAIVHFGPTPEMTERLRALLDREASGEIAPAEMAELDEYERLEHLMILLKVNTDATRFRPH